MRRRRSGGGLGLLLLAGGLFMASGAGSALSNGADLPGLAGRPTGKTVVAQARRYLGLPYQFGAEGPRAFDCSGLVWRVYRDLGVKLPRWSGAQAKAGRKVASLDTAEPGDLVYWDRPGSRVDHIGIYAGAKRMIVAPHSGATVRYEPIRRTPTAIRRVLPHPAAHKPAKPKATGLGKLPERGRPYAGLFAAAGKRHGVPPQLLAAVAQAESDFNSRAVSHAGARGLMQLMPGTARSLGVDPFDPAQAVDGAARLLKAHRERFGSTTLALAAYNAGAGAVRRYGNAIPPYPETQAYVRRVLDLAGPEVL